jgi:hypothetical protein
MHDSLQLFSNLVAVLGFKRDDKDQLAHCKSVTLRRPTALIQIKAALASCTMSTALGVMRDGDYRQSPNLNAYRSEMLAGRGT